MKKSPWLIPLLLLALMVLFPLVVDHDYYQHLMIQVLIWVIIGSSWNLLAGYTGQVSFGHAAFFGIGAYTAGILHTKLQLSPWWGMILGGPMAVILGLIIGTSAFDSGDRISRWPPSLPGRSCG